MKIRKPYTIALYAILGLVSLVALSFFAWMLYDVYYFDRKVAYGMYGGISFIALFFFVAYKSNQEQ